MDYVEGKIYKDPSLPGLSPEARSEVYSAMNRTIAQIHSVDVEKAGITDYGKHGDYVRRQVKTWSRQYEASKTEELESMNKVMVWLQENIPEQSRVSVVHGDFRVDNLIFDAEVTNTELTRDLYLTPFIPSGPEQGQGCAGLGALHPGGPPGGRGLWRHGAPHPIRLQVIKC